MIFGLSGDIKGIGSILKHPNPEFIQATNHWPIGTRTKKGLTYTGLVGKGFPDGGSLKFFKFVTGQNAPSLGDICGLGSQWRRFND